MTSVYDFTMRSIDGREIPLSEYRGKVLLVVNVASRCGFTNQYRGLEQLYRSHHGQGLEVLGYPCDQFGHQEPGDDAEILEFCSLTYDVTFPMFAKIDVNGAGADPLYRYLKREAKGALGSQSIKWNFTKFLVGRDGRVMKRYASTDTPESLEKVIIAALG